MNVLTVHEFAGWKDGSYNSRVYYINPSAFISATPVEMSNGSETFTFCEMKVNGGNTYTITESCDELITALGFTR